MLRFDEYAECWARVFPAERSLFRNQQRREEPIREAILGAFSPETPMDVKHRV
jgi:hypothetical protein